jgi:hypothetical protein
MLTTDMLLLIVTLTNDTLILSWTKLQLSNSSQYLTVKVAVRPTD